MGGFQKFAKYTIHRVFGIRMQDPFIEACLVGISTGGCDAREYERIHINQVVQHCPSLTCPKDPEPSLE